MAEQEQYQNNLETLVKARTEQLREALSRYENLSRLVQDAAPALRNVDDPAVKKLIEKFGDCQIIQANVDPIHALVEQLNAGAPIPPVSATDIKQIWVATRQMNSDRPPLPGFAVGLSVFAGYGVACAGEPTRFMAAKWRHTLLADLLDRGLLTEWVHNSEPDERVFEAAATVDCALADLGQATVKVIAQSDAELAAHATEALRAQGQDPQHPKIERRVLEWLRKNC